MPTIQQLGPVFQMNRMQELVVQVFEPLDGDQKTFNDLIIAGPAETREEATAIVDSVSRNSERGLLYGIK